MIGSDGWLDWAQRVPGVPDKVYPQRNKGLGIVCHSIEGSVGAALGRFMNTTKTSDGSYAPYAQASVMFINPKSGALMQMYPVTASPWTSGNAKANTELWSVESEGVAGEPLNANQVYNMVRLASEWNLLHAHEGIHITRGFPGFLALDAHDKGFRTLWEHNEVWNWASPNAGPTACPSGRYAPFYAALENQEEELDVNALERLARLERLVADDILVDVTKDNVAALRTAGIPDPPMGGRIKLSGEQSLAYADAQGMRFWLGLQLTQERVGALEAK